MLPRLVLASTSPHRRDLLLRLRLPFTTASPACDEVAYQARGLEPRVLAATLAAAKAEAVSPLCPGAAVIGCDQVCALGAEVLGKPGSRARAVAQLDRLRGRTHELITAVCVRLGDRVQAFAEVSRLHMRPLAAAEIERYVDLDQPFDCAGAYKVEAAGIALFERIDSADHTAIVGLPLLRLSAVLRELGFAVP
jgi:septum formation protein